MSRPLYISMLGRFGNQLFQYAHARARSEREGRELHTDAWIGQRIFQINDAPPQPGDERIRAYYQDQGSLIYSASDARRWFTFRPEIQRTLELVGPPRVAAHLRHGDYQGYGYVVISAAAVERAAAFVGIDRLEITWITEENPSHQSLFPREMGFLPDFWRMMRSEVLFRSNSTFSWWAATLGSCRVFAPVIVGLTGGIVHDKVHFVEGNWPRFAELPCVTDLHLNK